MEQTKALNALAPFLALSKSATSPIAASELITRATSHPHTYIFTELLETPQIQSLASHPEHSAQLSLLQIFSYGTYSDYTRASNLPPLNAAQTLKLRQLSLLTLAKDPAGLTYANVMHSLGLGSAREVEELAISAMYAGLVAGALDPYHQLVTVSSVAPLRDVPPNSIPAMLSTLSAWTDRCASTLQDLEAQIAGIKAAAAQRHREEREWSAQVDKLVEGSGKEEKDEKEKAVGGLFGGLARRLGSGERGGGSKRSFGGAVGALYDEDDLDGMDLDGDEDEIEIGVEKKGTRSSKRKLPSNGASSWQ